MNLASFKKIYSELNLSHHRFNISYNYLKWAFNKVDFKNKIVLDIGGGNGLYSYFSKFKGAKRCINLEPLGAGSKNVNINLQAIPKNLKIEIIRKTIQQFNTNEKFDIIILHDSINHLDEDNFSKIHYDKNSLLSYSKLLYKITCHLKEGGTIVLTDCSRYNFWGFIGVKNPFAPSIEWDIHQSPYLIKKIFLDQGFNKIKIRWSPFKRFGLFGRLLSFFGFFPSYFMQSHYNITIRK